MLGFAIKRLFFILGVSLGILFFVFFGLYMADNSVSDSPSYDPVPAARHAWQAATTYLKGITRGDLGEMGIRVGRQYRRVSVADEIVSTYPKSMGLLVTALFVAALVGIPLGTWAAMRRKGWLSFGTLTVTLLGISVPSFFLAALLQILEVGWYKRFGFRLVPVGGFGWDAHLVLPALVLAARPVAHLARIAYMAVTDIRDEDYVRTARAKGLSERIVLWVHIGRNASVPLLTALGVSFRFALASLPVVEYFFGWPGIGASLLDAITAGQDSAVAGMALTLGLTFLLVNLVLDLVYRYADPRVRQSAL